MSDLLKMLAAARPLRAVFAILVLAIGFAAVAPKALAATPAEQYVSDNVQKGITILSNKTLTKEQRRAQFQDFLLALTDIKVISEYTLGQYRRTASPAELAAFNDTFKNFALAVYQSYFTKFSGQTLQVTGSSVLSPDESLVKTVLVDPAKQSAKPLQVDFRVAKIGSRLAVIDFSVEGVWLRQAERDEFTSFLGQHSGDINALIDGLKRKTAQVQSQAK